MFVRRIVFAMVSLMVLLVILSGVGSAAYRAGWSQGFLVGQAADGEVAMPFDGHSGYHRGFGFPILCLLCPAGLLFFLFFGLMGRRHRRHWGHWGHGWHGHHKGHTWGQGHPWVNPNEPVQKA